MDQKSWLWRRKSSEKTAATADRVNLPFKGDEEEIVTILGEKAELENELKILKERLSSALTESKAKDDLVAKHSKMSQEAITGREKAEANAVSLKRELEDALQQRAAGEGRLAQVDAALKECMQQLRFVREEQEQRIHDAVMKASNEFEKAQMILEEKLAETTKRIAKTSAENTQLSKALLAKEKIIEDVSKQRDQVEADLNALMIRLESIEKDNASLKYEVRVLEKELEIRNEEREFNRRTADASHKQHLDSVKKIAKLEAECQRLRVLVRKRLPGPAALAKMKSEVETLGRDSVETRRRRSNDSFSDTAAKKIDFLTEQLCAMEEENKTLKEALNKKANELQFSRTMYARTASKLSQVESNLDELPKVQTPLEKSRSALTSHDLSLASMSDVGSDDKVSCAESWASALITELEHFKQEKQLGSPSMKTVGASEMDLMDDFVEMERLAIVSVDNQSRSPHVVSSEAHATVYPLESNLNGHSLGVNCREIVPLLDFSSGISNQEINSKDAFGKAPDWLQDILKVVLEQSQLTQRKPDEILEEVRIALANINNTCLVEYKENRNSSDHPVAVNSPHFGGLLTWKPTDKSLVMISSGGATDVNASLVDKSNELLQMDLGKPICKIIELIEGINSQYPEDGTTETSSKKNLVPYKNTESTSGYMVRLFQWKTAELSVILQQFVNTCYDVLNGKADLQRFAQELSSALEWILNHCFSLQDVSSMREAIRKQFECDEMRSENETEVGMMHQFSEVDKILLSQEKLSNLPVDANSNGFHSYGEKDEFQSTIRDENKKLKDELVNVESVKKELEERLHSARDKSESLENRLQESVKTIMSLQTELEALKRSEYVIENQKLAKEDLDTQLTAAKAELNEARHKLSSLEVEMENKNSCCEELEATCLELQLQLESVTKKAIPNHELHQDNKQLRTDWEITAASEKLAECQETILNLGKQLKALASPREAALFDNVIPSDANETADTPVTTATNTGLTTSENKIAHQRSSLLDQMLAEDYAKDLNRPKMKEAGSDSSSAFISNGVKKILILKNQDDDRTINSLAIVPKRKGSGGLWRKLLWRKKKSSNKLPPLSFAL